MSLLLDATALLVVTTTAAAAQTSWPPELEDRVQGLVAAAWEIPAEEVFLEWGVYSATAPTTDATLELLGLGRGGHWVLRMDLRDGTSASVQLRAGHLQDGPVAARRLSRGEILTDQDIRPVRSVVWDAPGDDGPHVAAGWEVQRPIEAGERLRSPSVRPPLAVVSGRSVKIVWSRGPIDLSVPGKAAGSAVLGQRVFVRTDSGARIQGLVIAPGVVDISDALERTSGGLS